jgi:superfamily I DNA and/or RNA helicase
MADMERPDRPPSVENLEVLWSSGEANAQEMLEALANQRSARAIALRSKILAAVVKGEDRRASLDVPLHSTGSSTIPSAIAQRIVKVAPFGTSDRSVATPRPLSRQLSLELPPNSTVLEKYIIAVEKLGEELRASEKRKQYKLSNGTRLAQGATSVLYQFHFNNELSDDAKFSDEGTIELRIDKSSVNGVIISAHADRIQLALESDIGADVPRALMLVHSAALYEKLNETLRDVVNGRLQVNLRLADAAVGAGAIPGSGNSIPSGRWEKGLNKSQVKAFRHVLSHTLTYIWGPPGTGKTHTLGAIVSAAFEAGQRVLVCSNTNRAVDEVLHRICKALTARHPALQQGALVRLRAIVDEEFQSEFGFLVSEEAVSDRLAKALNQRRARLNEELEALSSDIEAAQAVLQRFHDLDLVNAGLRDLNDKLIQVAKQRQALAGRLSNLKTQLQMLAEELGRARGLMRVFRRSPTEIRAEIGKTQSQLTSVTAQIEACGKIYNDLTKKRSSLQQFRESLHQELSGHERRATEMRLDAASRSRNSVEEQLREVRAQLEDLRTSIVRNARILGTTCTSAYRRAREIVSVDVVIIDEASMVFLPAAWFAAGMAAQRVVVCGDFRQLPPIVETDQQAIFDIIGQDVFTASGVIRRSARSPMVMLETQRRMDSAICALISQRMYDGRLITDPALTAEHQQRLRAPPPFDGALTIVDTSSLQPVESRAANGSRFNMMHALLVRILARHFQKSGFVIGKQSLAVCTPYRAQANLIRKLLANDDSLSGVQVGTVHVFQGNERRAVIIDITESQGTGKLGHFVQAAPPDQEGARLINVAVSRAESHLIIIANLTYLDKHLPRDALLRSILCDMQANGRVLPAFELLALRPVEEDLRGLIGEMRLDAVTSRTGVFTGRNFDYAMAKDLSFAQHSVVIFSGFASKYRMGAIGEMLRILRESGIRIRCVTRPPRNYPNGWREDVRGVLDALDDDGCVVDGRLHTHEKLIVIDGEVVWHGSLNMLSFRHNTDEVMTRVWDRSLAQELTVILSKLPVPGAHALQMFAEPENPRCGACKARSYYEQRKRIAYFTCEDECGWSVRIESLQSDRGSSAARVLPSKKWSFGTPAEAGAPCRDCGASTKRRNGPYGPFYGCSRFPACKGTLTVEEVLAWQRRGMDSHE